MKKIPTQSQVTRLVALDILIQIVRLVQRDDSVHCAHVDPRLFGTL